MASNKIATVVLFDVGSLVSETLDNSETFFKKGQWCLLRIIQRLIFSAENDELAVVIFGSQETDNNMELTSDGMYSNIVEFSNLQKADWDLYEKVQKLTTTEVMDSNWVEGLVVALDYLKNQSAGKRFKDKQIIILSNFAMELDCSESKLSLIAESMNLDRIKLVTIGIDLEEKCQDKDLSSQFPGSIGLLVTLIDKVENGISLSFTEAEDDIIYFKKKGKMGRFTKVNLTIGSKIDIPIRWIKLNLEPTRIKWVRKPPKKLTEMPRTERSHEMPRMNEDLPRVGSGSDLNETKSEVRYIMENQKSTKFGTGEVILDYADLEAMKRQTGPASCTLLGCVKSTRIRREMFIGEDLYLVVAEKAPRAAAMLSALVDALIATDKYALVRRVTTNNGKIKVGVLIPVSNETDNGVCKELFFLQLPFAEYALIVPEVKMPEPNDQEILEAFDNLIDTMTITDKPKDLPMKDPIFQYICHILQLYQTGMLKSDDKNPPVPDFIKNLVDPYPELLENALPIIEKLEKLLPIQIEERFLDSEEITNEQAVLKIEETKKSKVSLNQSATSNKEEENLDWVDAETQDWPDESILPAMNLKENVLVKNKYNTKYVSDRLWKDHGSKPDISADVQQMIDEKQDTQELDTEEMLQRVKNKF